MKLRRYRTMPTSPPSALRRRHTGAVSAHGVPSWPSINHTLRPFPSLAAACMPQQKILEDEFPLARPQRTAASTARYLTIVGFWAGLDFDDVVERAAMWAFKKRLSRGRNVRRFARHSHSTHNLCGIGATAICRDQHPMKNESSRLCGRMP
jgi:hypothetical protein